VSPVEPVSCTRRQKVWGDLITTKGGKSLVGAELGGLTGNTTVAYLHFSCKVYWVSMSTTGILNNHGGLVNAEVLNHEYSIGGHEIDAWRGVGHCTLPWQANHFRSVLAFPRVDFRFGP